LLKNGKSRTLQAIELESGLDGSGVFGNGHHIVLQRKLLSKMVAVMRWLYMLYSAVI